MAMQTTTTPETTIDALRAANLRLIREGMDTRRALEYIRTTCDDLLCMIEDALSAAAPEKGAACDHD